MERRGQIGDSRQVFSLEYDDESAKLYAATNLGLFESSDEGLTWRRLLGVVDGDWSAGRINANTVIGFQLPQRGRGELSIFNLVGQKIRTLVNARMGAGGHSVSWGGRDDDGRRVGSGVYNIYRLTTGELVQSKKLVLLK